MVLVHGLGVSSRYWVPFALLLAPHAEVHAVDLPGFGLSAGPPRALTLRELAESLAHWIDTTGLDRPVIVANSFGCQVSVELALRYPHVPASMVLVGPTTDPDARTGWRQFRRWLVDGLREPPSEMLVVLRDYLDCGFYRLRKTFGYALEDRIEDKLPRVQVSTLVVRGGRDPIVPERWARDAARLLQQGRLVVIPGAGHAVNYNAPLELLRVVLPFVQNVDSHERRHVGCSL